MMHGEDFGRRRSIPSSLMILVLLVGIGGGAASSASDSDAIPDAAPLIQDQGSFAVGGKLGVWPDFYPDEQFSHDTATLNQSSPQSLPNTGPYEVAVNAAAASALFDKIGPGVLVTHSQSGALGWRTATRNRNIRAIVSYEPAGDFVFPEGEAPAMAVGARTFTLPTIPLMESMELTKIRIVIDYGDNIPDQPSTNPRQEQWRVFRATARVWRDVVNEHGGDVTPVDLPAVGIR